MLNGNHATTISKDFDTTFPLLADEMVHFYERIDMEDIIKGEKVDQFWEKEMPLLLSRVDGEIGRVIGQPWAHLKAQNGKFVAMHTLGVLAMTMTDPMFANISPEL